MYMNIIKLAHSKGISIPSYSAGLIVIHVHAGYSCDHWQGGSVGISSLKS